MSAAIASLAVDATFNLFGRAATYAAPEFRAPVDCRIIRAAPDVSINAPGVTQAFARGVTVEVRASEIASPAKGGVFVCAGESLKIISEPRFAEGDPDRLVWRCTVA